MMDFVLQMMSVCNDEFLYENDAFVLKKMSFCIKMLNLVFK